VSLFSADSLLRLESQDELQELVTTNSDTEVKMLVFANDSLSLRITE
jgi:hypothetical protein